MACWEGKKYQLVCSENFNKYMEELGVGLILRKMGNTIKPIVELIKDEECETYTLKTTSPYINNCVCFKLFEEFDEVTIDGRTVKSVISLCGNKLIHEQKGQKYTTIIREFCDDRMIATLSVCDVRSVRVYKALPPEEEPEEEKEEQNANEKKKEKEKEKGKEKQKVKEKEKQTEQKTENEEEGEEEA